MVEKAKIPETIPQVPKVLLFDLGGVVNKFDSQKTFDYLEELGVPREKSQIFYQCPEYWDFCRGEINSQQFYEALTGYFGVHNLTYDQVKKSLFVNMYGVFPEMVALLQGLADKREVVITTDTNEWQMERLHQLLDLSKFRVFRSDAMGILKSDFPQIDGNGKKSTFFTKVFEELGVKQEETLFIDDNPEIIQKAKAEDIPSILFESPEKLDTLLRERKIIE